jgi:tetratricopeptide (TPR) repeat protein
MKKTTLALLTATLGLATALWFLPKGSVHQSAAGGDSAKASRQVAEAPAEADTTSAAHAKPIPATELSKLQEWRKSFHDGNSSTKKWNADSLATRFEAFGYFDSALVYRTWLVEAEKSESANFLAGEAAFKAFSTAASPAFQKRYAGQAQRYFQKVLAQNPKRMEAKIHLALTYVSGQDPMQGIRLLREVVAADPTNQEALFQLGILSLQSGQADKAVNRFEQILARYPKNTKARFYLGLAYKELGKPEKARQALERVYAEDPDPAVKATVKDYLAELNP